MGVFKVLLALTIAYIYLFSGISKIKDFNNHIEVINSYKITPKFLSKYLILLFSGIELVASVLIIFMKFTTFSIISLSVLTLIYSLAILINLLRGRNDLSCGCGGVLGDHTISYKLVLRNVILLIGLLMLFILPHQNFNYLEYAYMNVLVAAIFCLYLLLTETRFFTIKTKELTL